MNKENTDKLIKEFPKFFKHLRGQMFECGDGWFNLVQELCTELKKVLGDEVPDTDLVIVKEKFGGLRFQGLYSDKTNDIIDDFENKSYSVCEICGKPGKRRNRSWIRTSCEDCDDVDKARDVVDS